MAENKNVAGEVLVNENELIILKQNDELQKKFNEFQRQIRQNGGYPFDFKALIDYLQDGTEGKFSKKEIKEFSSKLFQKTTTLQIKKCKGFEIKEENIRSFLAPVYKREKERGNSVSTDNDLWNYFQGEKVSGIQKNFTSTIYRFLSDLTHQKVLDEAERTGIKKVHSFTEGLSIILEAVLAGEVDKKGTGIFVYFKMKEDGPLCRFRAYRYDDGELDLYVDKVGLAHGWGAGCGISFRNN